MDEQQHEPTQNEPVERGALEEEQENKGYGADEGERDEALENE